MYKVVVLLDIEALGSFKSSTWVVEVVVEVAMMNEVFAIYCIVYFIMDSTESISTLYPNCHRRGSQPKYETCLIESSYPRIFVDHTQKKLGRSHRLFRILGGASPPFNIILLNSNMHIVERIILWRSVCCSIHRHISQYMRIFVSVIFTIGSHNVIL